MALGCPSWSPLLDGDLQSNLWLTSSLSCSRHRPSSPGLDWWCRGCKGWLDLLGFQLWEGLGGRIRSKLIWYLWGINRNWEW